MEKQLININSLVKMRKILEKFLFLLENEKLDDLSGMGAVQAFEICYELSWKTLQKFISREGIIVSSPRETFRIAAQFGYIDNPQVWFEFAEQRNLTVHTYQEEILNDLLNLFKLFFEEFDKLIKKLALKNEE